MSYSKELEMANFNQTQGMGFNGDNHDAQFDNPHMLERPFVGPMPNKTEKQSHQVPLPHQAQGVGAQHAQSHAVAPQSMSQSRSNDVSECHVKAGPQRTVNGLPDSRGGAHMHSTYSSQEHVLSNAGYTSQEHMHRNAGYSSQELVHRNAGYSSQELAQRNNNHQTELSFARSGGSQASRHSNQRKNYSQPVFSYEQANNQIIQRNFEPQGNNTMQQYTSNPYNAMQQSHSYDRRGFQSNVPFHGTMPQQPMQQVMPQQGGAQYGMPQHAMPQHGNAQQGIAHYGMPQQRMAQQDMPQQGMAQQDMPQQGIAQYGMPQHGNAQQRMAQQDMPQQRMAQQDMPQQSIAQYGMPQHGNAQQRIAQQGMPQQHMGMRSEPLPKALQANHAAERPVAAPKQMSASAPMTMSTPNEQGRQHGIEPRQQPQAQSLSPSHVAESVNAPKAHALVQAQPNVASMQHGTQAPAVVSVAHGVSTDALVSQQEDALVKTSATSVAAPRVSSIVMPADNATTADVAKLDVAASQVAHALDLDPAVKQKASSNAVIDAPLSTGCAAAKAACEGKVAQLSALTSDELKHVANTDEAHASAVASDAAAISVQTDAVLPVATARATETVAAKDAAAVKAQGEAQDNVLATAQAGAKGEAQDKVLAKAQAGAKGEVQAGAKGEAQDKVLAKAQADAKGEAQDKVLAKAGAKGDAQDKVLAKAQAGAKGEAQGKSQADAKGEAQGKSQAKSTLEESKVPNFFAKPSVQVSSSSKLEDRAHEPKLVDSRIAFDMLDSKLPPVSVPFHAAEVMGNVPMKDHKYVFQPDMLKSVLMFLNNPGNDSLFISGPSGCGKTSAVMEIAARLNWPIESVTLSQRTEVCDLIGRNVLRHGELHYEYGPLAKAMLYGEILLLNEIDLLSPGELAALNDVIEGKTLTVISNMGEKLYAHPGFRIIATANSKGNGDASGFYQGVCYQNQAFLDRWEFLECDYANNKQALQMITTVYPTINPDFAKLLIRFSNVIRYGTANPRGNHHDTVLTTYRTYDSLLSEQNGNRTIAYDLLTEEMPDIADALRRSLRAQQDAQVGEAENDVGVVDADYLDYLRVKREKLLTERYLDKTAGNDAKRIVDAAISQNKDLVASAGDVDPSEVKKPNILQIIDSLNDLMVGRALSNTLHDRSFSFRSHISAPLTDRALLRICRFYVTYPQMSVEECINAGFGSRLNADEFELVMRLTYDVFGYGSGINELPHNTDMNDKYMQLRARYPKIVSAVERAEEAMLSREEFFIMKRKKLAELDQKMAEIASKDYRIVHPSYRVKSSAIASSDAQSLASADAQSLTSTEAMLSDASSATAYVEAVDAAVEALSNELDGSNAAAVCNVATAVDKAASASLGELASADERAEAVSVADASADTHSEPNASSAVKEKVSKPKRARKSNVKAASAESASETAPTKRKRSTSKAKAVSSTKDLATRSAAELLGAISSDEDTSAEQASA